MVAAQQFQFIQYGVTDALATLAINRPPFNVLDIPTMAEVNTALDACMQDRSVKLLVVTGVGEKAFSAGVEVADHTPDKVDQMIEVFHGIFRRLQKMPMPTVAAVNGVALGGGMELAIGCDMIVAVAGAKFGQPEIKLAVFPPIAAVLLPRLMPPARAMEVLLGGENFTAEEGLAMGLINRVFARESFATDVQAFLAPFLKHSRVALLSTRRAMRAADGETFAAALDTVEHIYLKELMQTDDAKEGLAAFLEKRKPLWRNT
ncbi:MAG: enoyl-CoA hydratase-related protein [Comamonadaceae bacterium]